MNLLRFLPLNFLPVCGFSWILGIHLFKTSSCTSFGIFLMSFVKDFANSTLYIQLFF